MNYFHLANRVVLKEKVLFFLLQFSLLLLSFIILSIYFLINGIQEVKFSAIYDVKNYDVKIYENENKKIISADDIKSLKGAQDVFQISQINLYSKKDNSVIELRMVSDNLFTSKRFNSQFSFLNPPKGDTVCVSTMTSFSPLSQYYYIKRSAFNRAMIANTTLNEISYFVSKDPICENIAFATISNKLFDDGEKYLGIYASNLSLLERQLRSLGIKYRTYKDADDTLTVALLTERYLFTFALFIIFLVLVILLYRLMLRSTNENVKNIKTFSSLGLRSRKIYALFTLPMTFLSIVSIALGVFFAIVFSKSHNFLDKYLKPYFGDIELYANTNFVIFYIAVSVFFMLLFSLLLIHKCNMAKKVDYYE